MAISFVNGQTVGTAAAATSVTVNKPTGVVVNDLMLWAIGTSTASPAAPTIVAGWTNFETWFNTTTSPNAGISVWYRFVDGTEAASFTRNTLTSGRWNSAIVAYRGVDLANPKDTANVTANLGSGDVALGSITTVTPGAWVLGFKDYGTASGDVAGSLTSSNLTNLTVVSSTAAAATNGVLGIGSLTQATPGAVTPVLTPATSATRAVGISAALRPLVLRPTIANFNHAAYRAATR